MKTLKELYNLSYDKSGFNSSLINWYNQLIDKFYNQLDVIDVCKMIRQDILKEVAIKRMIDLFLEDPYAGEFSDGGLLNMIIELKIKKNEFPRLDELKAMLNKLKIAYDKFDWIDQESKQLFVENLKLLDEKLK